MKQLITSAMALSLLMGGNALAQDKDKHGGGKHQGGQQQQQQQSHQGGGGKHNDRPPQSGGPNPYAGRAPANPSYRSNNPPALNRGYERRNDNLDRNRNDNRGQNVDRNRNDNRNQNWDRNRNDNRNQNWNRNDRHNQNWNRNREWPRQFDRRAYQRNTWAHRKYHRGAYHRPHGWYYRRWSYGQILPFIFFSQNYWLNDWYDYGLPVPPYGYEWVRYGDDAILVDVRTGMILQVMYGVFY